MPELPEVETVRQTLLQWLPKTTIEKVECFYPPMMKPSIATFRKHTENQTIKTIDRRGKHLLIHLTNDWTIISHLRMEGKYHFQKESDSLPRYAIAVFHLKNKLKLVYSDTRKFGTLMILPTKDLEKKGPISRLGPEPKDVQKHPPLVHQIQQKQKAIKDILLDQTIIAGVGNIYADEILYRSQIHPETQGRWLTKKQIESLLFFTKEVIEEAVKVGGSTIRTYHSPSGVDGLFQLQLKAYGREGKPCERCQTPLVKKQWHGRGTTFCRVCQHRTKRPFVVGLTGEIATGKSTFLHLAQDQGWFTVSSDTLVKEIYSKKKHQIHLQKLFGKSIVQKGRVDSVQLLHRILEDERDLNKLEHWIHPLVLTEIRRMIEKTLESKVLIEMPLLFKAGFAIDCDWIVGITMPPSLQQKILTQRNGTLAGPLWKLNTYNDFSNHEKEVNTLIQNDGSFDQFKKRCKEVLSELQIRAQTR